MVSRSARVRCGLRSLCLAVVSAVALSVLSGSSFPMVDGPEPAPAVREAVNELAAMSAARAQGSRVAVVSLRTPTQEVYANPGGTMTAEFSVVPKRVERDGRWVAVDTTVVRRADGTVGPRAALGDLSLSGGGAETPLVRMVRDGKSVAMFWPGGLPKPRLDGAKVTYPNVLPGVDLEIRVDPNGYQQLLVVRTAEAARNPALARLKLRTDAVGLRLTADEAGAVTVVDDTGEPVFGAAPSVMWDSSGRAPSNSVTARSARVGVSVETGSLVLRPDLAFLSDPTVVYPVTIDPKLVTYPRVAWATVLSGKRDTSYWWTSGSPPWSQVGQCYTASGECNGIGEARTYYQFDTREIAGKRIISTEFRGEVVYSPNCDAKNHQLYVVTGGNQVTGRTTWANMPAGGHLATASVPGSYSSCPGWKPVGFPFPAGHVADGVGAVTTFFLKAEDTSVGAGEFAWRKYDPTKTMLSITYNSTPSTPELVGTDPPTGSPCKWCGGVPYVGDASIRLLTRLKDPDGDKLRAKWRTKTNGVETAWDGAVLQNSGATHDATVNLGDKHGKTVQWWVHGFDGVDLSPHGWGKTFAVDRVPPNVRPTVSSVEYPEDNRWHGGIDVDGTFTFTSNGVQDNGVNDIDHYLYGWSSPPSSRIDAVGGLGGDASVRLIPPGDGPRTLYVQSVDRAGHKSETRTHRIYVRAGNGALSQWSFEGNADDTAFLGDRHGTLQGASSYAPGVSGNAIRFSGDGFMTAPNTVDTRGSFSVAAWVRVENATGTHTVVSQDGADIGAFRLGYHSGATDAGWFFELPRTDNSSPVVDVVRVPGVPAPAEWTHLAAVYDAERHTATLYVDGEAVHLEGVSAMRSQGVLRVGSALVNGTAGSHWRGQVDEVRVYDRPLRPSEVDAAVSGANVRVADWQFEDETGMTARNSVNGGEDAVLTESGAAFDENAMTRNGVLRLTGGYAQTSGPLLRTDQSFSVMARVSVEAGLADGLYTVLSQDGVETCGFCLRYAQASGVREWVFTLPDSDVDGPIGLRTVRAPMTQAPGDSTHVAAVYNAGTGTLDLYVNGAKTTITASSSPPWNATGKFALGRTLVHGQPGQVMRGWIDEARAYSRAISQDEVRGLLAADGVTAGTWKLDGNANATSGGGSNGVLHGAPEWAAGQSSNPDPEDLAVRLNGVNQYLALNQPVIAASESFAVTAWVRLDKVGSAVTVVSQDATNRSGFSLGALPDGRWVFTAPKSDAAGAEVDRAASLAAATQAGVWTHLAGVYSRDRSMLELYVNGVLAGSAPHARVTTTGNLAIGRSKLSATQHGEYFPGAIDDVSVYSRVLFAGEVHTMAGRDLSLAHHWQLDENAGTAAADSVGVRGGTLSGGASFEPGWVGNGVSLNGTNSAISTSGLDVSTTESFSVSAWVRFNPTPECASAARCMSTAVSADGTTTSKFRLGHVKDRVGAPWGSWVFEMPGADAGGQPSLGTAALEVSEAERDRWVHLVGVYDAQMKKLWLYVNGDRVGDGTLETQWSATGGLQIGRGKASGTAAQYWSGGVDDVRVYTGVQNKERVKSLYDSYPTSPPAPEPPAPDAGYWSLDEGTGDTAADASDHHRHLTLSNGASWQSARSSWGGGFDGVGAYAATSGPVVDTAASFSVSAWALAKTSSGPGTVLGQDGAEESAFAVQYRPSDSRWVVRVPTDTGTETLVSTEAALTGRETHLTITYDAPQGRLRLYVNGSVSSVRFGVSMRASSGPLTLGRSLVGGQPTEFLNGHVDDVRAFSRVLTDGEIREVYDDVYLAVQGNWRLDGSAVDDSWRQNTVTLSGGPSFVVGVNDRALRLNGTTQAATAREFGVPMNASFTVSAWARLTATDRVQTVLGQDGARTSGYVLQYRPELNRWVFGAPAQDADGAALVAAVSSLPPTPQMWTHLTGVYDYPARQVRLYVDGALAGSRNNVFLWQANGAFTIGRGKIDGAAAQFLAGDVDEVTTDIGAAADSEIERRASFPAPPIGQWGRFGNGRGEYTTARTDVPAPTGYHFAASLGGVPPAEAVDTTVLYSCQLGVDKFTSASATCEGQTVLGEAGRVYANAQASPQTVPLYRCKNSADHFESLDPACEGMGTKEGILGHTVGFAPFARYNTPQGWDHASTIHGVPPGYRAVAAQGYTSLVAMTGGHQLFNCREGMDLFVSDQAGCEGKTVVSSIGWAWTEPPDGVPSVPIFRCAAGSQSFVAWSEGCEGQTLDRALGHLVSVVPGLPEAGESASPASRSRTVAVDEDLRAGTRPTNQTVVGWVS
jgi:Concanavalin A-like lectin/glucanases superfamily